MRCDDASPKRFLHCYFTLGATLLAWACVLFFLDLNYEPCTMEQTQINVTNRWMFNCTAYDPAGHYSTSELIYDPCHMDHCILYDQRLFFIPGQEGQLLIAAQLDRVCMGGFGVVATICALIFCLKRSSSRILNRPRFELYEAQFTSPPDVAFALAFFTPLIATVFLVLYSVSLSRSFAFGWSFLPTISYIPLVLFRKHSSSSSTSMNK